MLRFLATLLVVGAMAAGCATLPDNSNRMHSSAFTDTADTLFGKGAAKLTAAHPGQSGFHLLGNGLDAFVARAVLTHYAERSIDVQYYLYHNDLVGRLFTDLLLKAADRGVRVRLLVDDMDLADRDLGAAALDSHPNIEVRIFNPFSRQSWRLTQFVTRMGSVTRRMHNKSFTVDNQVAILGGRNIGNEYFEASPDLAFADLDVMAIGPVVSEVSSAFDLFWNSELAYPATQLRGEAPSTEVVEQLRTKLDAFVAQQQDSAYLKALRDSNLATKIRERKVTYDWGGGTVLYDRPEKILQDTENKDAHLAPQMASHFKGVQDELIIFSPYFVPGKAGTAYLVGLAERGVRVRILTNSLASNDVGIVHSGYAKYRKALLRGGVALYEMNKKLTRKQRKEKKGSGGSSKASLHAKSFVFDRQEVFIGSLNLDPRAVVHNTEIGVVIQSDKIGADMAAVFERVVREAAFRLELVKSTNGSEGIRWHGMVDGELQTFDVDPYTGFWRRFGIGFMGLLPIESQL
jgi:putative cardiolipin synthase